MPTVIYGMKILSQNVQGITVPISGHYIPEEQPDFLIDQLFKFFGEQDQWVIDLTHLDSLRWYRIAVLGALFSVIFASQFFWTPHFGQITPVVTLLDQTIFGLWIYFG